MTAMPEVFGPYLAGVPAVAATRLTGLIQMSQEVAEGADIPVSAALKWGQPTLSPPKAMGTPLRFAWSTKAPHHCQLLVHCQTSLVRHWREMFPQAFTYHGTRAVAVPVDGTFAEDALALMVRMTFTYHQARLDAASPRP